MYMQIGITSIALRRYSRCGLTSDAYNLFITSEDLRKFFEMKFIIILFVFFCLFFACRSAHIAHLKLLLNHSDVLFLFYVIEFLIAYLIFQKRIFIANIHNIAFIYVRRYLLFLTSYSSVILLVLNLIEVIFFVLNFAS